MAGTDCCCSSDMMDEQNEIIPLNEGMDLIISDNPLPMRGVVMLLLQLNSMKKKFLTAKQKLNNKELSRILIDSVLETTVVSGPLQCSPLSGQRKLVFMRLQSSECTMTDDDKKDITCAAGATPLQLQAATLGANNSSDKVKFKMGTYGCPGVAQTVVLSIVNHNKYMSCSNNGDEPELKLENCSADDVKEICKDGSSDRFLFFKQSAGIDRVRFESVLCRGWFICTRFLQEDEPLRVCKVDTPHCVFSFILSQR